MYYPSKDWQPYSISFGSDEKINEIQTYNMSKALEFFRQGHEVYIDHPLDEDDAQKMHNKEEFEDGYLYIIKGQLGEVQS